MRETDDLDRQIGAFGDDHEKIILLEELCGRRVKSPTVTLERRRRAPAEKDLHRVWLECVMVVQYAEV